MSEGIIKLSMHHRFNLGLIGILIRSAIIILTDFFSTNCEIIFALNRSNECV